jgi:hypothetical protein
MFGFMLAGIIIVVTVFFTLCRIAPLKRWLGYATWVDVTFTVLMLVLFHDTFSGVMSAAFAGLFMAVMLTVLRKAIGFERMHLKRTKWWFEAKWVQYVPIKPRAPKFVRVMADVLGGKHA